MNLSSYLPLIQALKDSNPTERELSNLVLLLPRLIESGVLRGCGVDDIRLNRNIDGVLKDIQKGEPGKWVSIIKEKVV